MGGWKGLREKFYKKMSLLIFFLCFTTTLAAPTPKDCPSLLEKADSCITRAALFGDANIPRSNEEMDVHCSLGQEYSSCVKAYGKCLKPFPRQILYLMISNMKKLMKDTCDSETKRQEFLLHSKCMTPEKIPRVKRLLDKVTIHLNHIAYNVSKEAKIPFICCSFFVGREEMEREVTEMCESTETKEWLIKMMERAVNDAVDLACGKYSSIQVCRKEIPEGMETLERIIQDQYFVPQNSSFFVPLMAITEDLDD